MERADSLKRRRLKKLTLWFSLFLSLWLTIGGVERAVLCFESGGHLQLEFLRDASCNQVQAKAASLSLQTPLSTSLSFPSTADDCSPCMDIALSIINAVQPSAPYSIILVSQQQPFSAHFLPALIVDCVQKLGIIRSPEQRPALSGQTRAILSSIVLLI